MLTNNAKMYDDFVNVLGLSHDAAIARVIKSSASPAAVPVPEAVTKLCDPLSGLEFVRRFGMQGSCESVIAAAKQQGTHIKNVKYVSNCRSIVRRTDRRLPEQTGIQKVVSALAQVRTVSQAPVKTFIKTRQHGNKDYRLDPVHDRCLIDVTYINISTGQPVAYDLHDFNDAGRREIEIDTKTYLLENYNKGSRKNLLNDVELGLMKVLITGTYCFSSHDKSAFTRHLRAVQQKHGVLKCNRKRGFWHAPLNPNGD